MSPAHPAKACSPPAPASHSIFARLPCSHKSNTDAAAPYIPLPYTAPAETETAKSAPGNTARTAHSLARDTSPQDQNPPRSAPPAAPLPDTSTANPTTPCRTALASLPPKKLPTATYRSSDQTAKTQSSTAPAATNNRYRPKPAVPSRSAPASSNIPV